MRHADGGVWSLHSARRQGLAKMSDDECDERPERANL